MRHPSFWYFLTKFIFPSSSHQYPYTIWVDDFDDRIDTDFESCEDRVDFLSGDVDCKCDASFPTQLWSMKKMTWAKKPPEFPTHISMLSGCAVSINRNKVLFIGGHYTQHQFSAQTWNSDVST